MNVFNTSRYKMITNQNFSQAVLENKSEVLNLLRWSAADFIMHGKLLIL